MITEIFFYFLLIS